MTERPESEAFIPRKANMRRTAAILRRAMEWYQRNEAAS